MNILHVTRETGTDPRYGIRKSLLPVIEDLRRKGHTVEIFDRMKAASVTLGRLEQWIEKAHLNWIKYRFGQEGHSGWAVVFERVFIGWRAAKYAVDKNVSHVYCHDSLLGYYYDLFAKCYGATRRWGFTVHTFGRFVKLRMGIYTSNKSLKYLQKRELKAIRTAKWIVFPTQTGMDQMTKDININLPESRCHVVPHPVKVSLMERSSARKKIGVSKNEHLLIAVGQLIPMKRFDLLLRSIAFIETGKRPHIIILGEGPEKDNLYQLAAKTGITSFKINATDHIGRYLAAADMYVSTSSTESFGMANCEALIAGVPSVCTKVDAVPELLKDGAMLTGDDPQEIADAIQKLLTDDLFRKELVNKAWAVAAEWPAPEQIANKFENILTSCK
jgi:glycosyltransferase involved in cell wall biosynthesis